MAKDKSCLFTFLRISVMLFLMSGLGGEGRQQRQMIGDDHRGSKLEGTKSTRKLFVLGDSYADTGNLPKIISPSWSEPYGITFPRKPSGRFSDGRILTDYVASFLGIKSPIPYKYRRYGQKLFPYGMNFAVGGSGVFDTGFLQDNLTVQIDTFKQLLDRGNFSSIDLRSSAALVSVAGNDYVYFRDNGGSMEGLKTFTPKLINQLKLDLKRLCDMGVPTVAVTNLHPIGCLPSFTSNSSYKECNTAANLAVMYHNTLLEEAAKDLNKNSTGGSSVVIVDLFDGFLSVINQGRKKPGNILRPCCEPMNSSYSCGYVDLDGAKKYTVCSRRDSAFYWDSSHPTQAGWNAVFSFLRPSLNNLFY